MKSKKAVASLQDPVRRKKKETIRKKKKLKRLKKLKDTIINTRSENNMSLSGSKSAFSKIKKSNKSSENCAEIEDGKGKSLTASSRPQAGAVSKPKKNTFQILENMERQQKQQRVKQLKVANELEDKNIRRIEKQLKMHKRKTKSIPKSFVDDGLDFLLEVCDPEKRSKLAHEEFDFADNDAGFEEDLALLKNKKPKSVREAVSSPSHPAEIKKRDEDPSDSDVDSEASLDSSSEDVEEATMDSLDEESESESVMEEEESDLDPEAQDVSHHSSDLEKEADCDQGANKQNGYWEDIYGRLRDPTGKVVDGKVETVPSGKYVPPGKRLQNENADESAEMEKLKRQLKGFFNRLAEANLPGIVSSIEQLYLTNTRHRMQQAINTLIIDSLVGPVLSPERMIMEHCVLVAALHANIGTEVGAQFLEVVIRKFDSLYEDNGHVEDKVMDNLILILAHLYNFGLVAAPLLTDVLRKLADRFSEKDIELILIILRSVGFTLRKDDPVALKQIILNLQTKAGQAADQPSRIRFMLEILMAIRNNNMTKIPNYDPSHSEHLRKILRNSLVRKGASLSKMNISYNELLAADRRGRWWVVGSAWTGQGPAAAESKDNERVDGKELQFSAELLEMARKQRMNTDVRRNIFCILMTAEDFLEATERLLRLNLKSQQEREIIHVAIDCCLHERTFNPYYAHVVQKFCHLHRRFQIATQFAFWDRFKDLASLSTLQMAHLAKLLVQLVSDGALTLGVLKVIQFSEMDRRLVRFLRQILLGLLLHPSETVVQSALQRIGSSKFHLLKEGLTLFMHHFLLKNVEKMEEGDAEKLTERVQLAEQVLSLGLT